MTPISRLAMSRAFASAHQRLHPHDRRRVQTTLHKLLTLGLHHPSLQAHRILSISHLTLWDVYISRKALRLVIDLDAASQTLRLWAVGSHTSIDTARRLSQQTHTFIPITLADLAA